jgi:holo-[acyl-carrier protein] synthase
MNVLGIGIDATDIPRVAEMFARYGDRFLQRVFTDREIAYCTRHRNPAPHLAGRFAAKEAAMKARGTGHACGVLWRDVEGVR